MNSALYFDAARVLIASLYGAPDALTVTDFVLARSHGMRRRRGLHSKVEPRAFIH